MKKLILIFLISTSAFADIQNCLKDAESHGHNVHAITPSKECFELIKNHPEKKEFKSLDGSIHILGIGHMLYVSIYENGNLISQKLLAGDQTELTNIKAISVNKKKNKLLVLQEDSLNTYELTFIGNVTPLRKISSGILSSIHSAFLLDDQDMIALLSKKSVMLVNAQADSRGRAEKLRLVKKFSDINTPKDIVFHVQKNQFYILDQELVREVRITDNGSRILNNNREMSEFHQLKINNDRLMLIKSTGEEVEINLTN